MPAPKTKSVKAVVTNAVPAMIKPVRKVRPWVRLVGFAVGGIVTAGIIFVAIIVGGSYTGRWHAPVVKAAASILPYPAVTVNGDWESYYDFLDTVAALDRSYSQPGALEASGLTSKPTRADLEALVLDRMAKDAMVRQLAADRGVTIMQTALDAAMRDVIDQAGSEADVRSRISDLYGWDLNTFAKRVVEPFLYRQRLQEKIAFDDQINAEQKTRIEALLTRVQAGKDDFGAIAEEVNEDGTKSLKGDYGIFARGERDPAIEEVVFAMNPGDTSQIIRTAQGFHIFKFIERIPADDKAGTEEKVHVSHIFLAAKQLDAWLFEQASSQKVRLLVSGYRWDATNARVVSKSAPATNTNQ